MRTLKDLAVAKLFNPQEENLFQFLERNADEYQIKANRYEDNGIQMADWGNVLVEGQKYRLVNLFQSEYLVGYAKLHDGVYAVTTKQFFPNTYQILFIKAEHNTFSEMNKKIGGATMGIYAHSNEYPEMLPVLENLIGDISYNAYKPFTSFIDFIKNRKKAINELTSITFDLTSHSFDSHNNFRGVGYIAYDIRVSGEKTYTVHKQAEVILAYNDDQKAWAIDSILNFDESPFNVDDIYEEEEDINELQDLLTQYVNLESIRDYKDAIMSGINFEKLNHEYSQLTA